MGLCGEKRARAKNRVVAKSFVLSHHSDEGLGHIVAVEYVTEVTQLWAQHTKIAA